MKIKPSKKQILSTLIVVSSMAGSAVAFAKVNNFRNQNISQLEVLKNADDVNTAECTITCLNTCGFTNKC